MFRGIVEEQNKIGKEEKFSHSFPILIIESNMSRSDLSLSLSFDQEPFEMVTISTSLEKSSRSSSVTLHSNKFNIIHDTQIHISNSTPIHPSFLFYLLTVGYETVFSTSEY